MSDINRRAFIRHPVFIPLNVELASEPIPSQAVNISVGGLLFLHKEDLPTGTPIRITIPFAILNEPATISAVVVRSTENDHGFEIGAAFTSEAEALRARLVEQIVRIDDYRKTRGIEDFDAAADEWIKKYSENFPYE